LSRDDQRRLIVRVPEGLEKKAVGEDAVSTEQSVDDRRPKFPDKAACEALAGSQNGARSSPEGCIRLHQKADPMFWRLRP
jgi:hypothetical protein